ncbi:MAG: hypothetical protein K2X55_24910 [Burkholderiaceae bacterium]|nr:hypothetical protein [Burkholderiaceae bacterium]
MPATVQQRIEKSLAKSKASVFVRADFVCFGSPSQVRRALRAALDDGALVRAGFGIYLKARKSSLTGKTVPALSLVEVGLQALAKLGVKAGLGRSAQAYASGQTTQMPMAAVVQVGKSRGARRIGFGNKAIRSERG